MKRLLLIAVATLLLLNAVALVAAASGEENRRVDTSNVVEADQGESRHETGGDKREGAAEVEKEAHHPVWMFTGWQTVFTILAVLYYAIAVKILPLIMAKEEGGHH